MMKSLRKDDELSESFNFQKNIKDKQGKLFNQEPEFLKGRGLQGEIDNEINYQISINSSNLFNTSQAQQFGKEITIAINVDDVNLLQSTSKQFSNSQVADDCPSADQSILQKANDISFNHQHAPNFHQATNDNTRFNGNISKLNSSESNPEKKMILQSNSNISSEHQNNSLLVSQSQTNRKKWLISKYGDHLNNSSLFQSSHFKKDQSEQLTPQVSKFDGGKNKLVDKMVNVELAKNIICNVFHKSHNRKERVKTITKEFINKLMVLSAYKKPDKLKELDYQFINDLTYFKEKKVSKNMYRNFSLLILTKFKLLKHSFKVILPTNTFLIIWDICSIAFTYIFCYIYSIMLFFDQTNKEGYFLNNFIYVAFFLFFFDMLINFNIAYYSKDKIITSRRQIAKKYISSFFIPDFSSIVVLSLKTLFINVSLQYNPTHEFVIYLRNILIFLKLLGISKKRKRIEDVIIFNDNQKLIFKIISLIFFTVTIAHFVGITWHSIAIIENNYNVELTWMKKLNIEDSPFYTRYIYSVYWSMTTMTTIGYGDITPQNQYESLFTTLNMIFLSCVFAYSINNIGMILQEIEKKSRILRDEISTFQRFLDRKKVNIELKSRVRHYLKFLANEQKDRNKDKEDQIFQKLSNELRDQVTTEINTSIIDRYHIFNNLFTKKTREQMVFVMKEVLVSPNEIIFLDNQIDDQAIYFVQGGCIELYHNDIQKVQQPHLRIKLLQQNDLFGELSFFSGLSRKASARSMNLSTLYKIKRSDFIDIIKQNQEDFEKFKMVQDKILNLNDLSCIGIKCYTCQKENHLSLNCPNIHQRFDTQFQILKSNYSLDQQRKAQTRKFKALLSPWDLVNRNKTYLSQLKDNIEKFNTQMQIMLQDEEEEYKDRIFTYQTASSYENNKSQEDDIEEGTQMILSQSFQVENPMFSDKEKEKATSDHSSFYPEKQQQLQKNYFQRKNKTNQSIKMQHIQQIQEENEENCSKVNTIVMSQTDPPVANLLESDSNKAQNQNLHQENLPTSMSFTSKETQNFHINQLGRKQTFISKKEYRSSNLIEGQINSKGDIPANNDQILTQSNQQISSYEQSTPQYGNKEESNYNQQDNKTSKEGSNNVQQIQSQQHQHYKYFQQVSSKLFNYDSQNTFKQAPQQHNNSNNNLIQSIQTDLLAYKNEQDKAAVQKEHISNIQNHGNQSTQRKKMSVFKDDIIPTDFAALFDLINKINQNNQLLETLKDQTTDDREEDINSFDKIKLYKYYFPHNNFDKIMHEYKIKKQEQQIMEKIQKKMKGKAPKQLKPLLLKNNISKQSTIQQQENINPSYPTTLSYGVGTKANKIYAIKSD